MTNLWRFKRNAEKKEKNDLSLSAIIMIITTAIIQINMIPWSLVGDILLAYHHRLHFTIITTLLSLFYLLLLLLLAFAEKDKLLKIQQSYFN